MGIINATPDSFYAGSRRTKLEAALELAEEMIAAGADILDIGGMSSRPGAPVIDEAEEKARVIPVIEAIHTAHPQAILSVDTVRAGVARAAVAAGASMINDISAGSLDPNLFATVADLQVPYVLMHMRGRPENMQQQTDYADVVTALLDFFEEKIYALRQLGIKDIVLDPGFGFGKTLTQNYEIMRKFSALRLFNLPLLAGVSRKSMIYKLLETTPEAALNGSTVLHLFALQQGARILRVHDVGPAKEVTKIWGELKKED
jgi:dihydropteroate synthase